MIVFANYVFKKFQAQTIVRVPGKYKMQFIFHFIQRTERTNSKIFRGFGNCMTVCQFQSVNDDFRDEIYWPLLCWVISLLRIYRTWETNEREWFSFKFNVLRFAFSKKWVAFSIMPFLFLLSRSFDICKHCGAPIASRGFILTSESLPRWDCVNS